MTALVEKYLRYLSNEKKASRNTTESYIRDVKKYVDYTIEEGLEGANKNTLINYLNQLQANGISASTLSRHLASIRSFYNYLCKRKLADCNPADDIKSFRIERKLPLILTDEEVTLLLSQPRSDEIKGCRDKAMLETLYATGMRVSELVDIKMSELNLKDGYIICPGGNKRVVYLYPKAIDALDKYIKNSRPYLIAEPDTDYLFFNCNGAKLTRQGFWKILNIYKKQAAIDKDITPHTFRHSFAAHLIENGAELKDVSEMLGHAAITSTQVYAQIANNKLVEVYKSTHPRA